MSVSTRTRKSGAGDPLIAFRLPPDLLADLRAAAERTDETVSALLRDAVRALMTKESAR